MKLSGNTILITGGSSGIGRQFARQFHALGNFVIITGRRMDALQETIGERDNMQAYQLDMTDADAIAEFAKQITTTHPGLNILMNNAGIMRPENLKAENIDTADAQLTIATNLLAPIQLGYALLPHLRTTQNAAILNVTSGLAFTPLFATPTYNATKAALHSWTLSLRGQFEKEIDIIEIIPPGVQSDIMEGHADDPAMMTMDDFITETMHNFHETPVPLENCVERVLFLRNAEKENRLEQTMHTLNALHR
ncbi:SDR family oxidoreductase [Hirschia baltica]|uniref:Short-chain dehydrogenase/reductase SDR n=1 Tax=Hirschia baltica (strain ATCC 49814 / DSM 5838 / IFAM 1418) TaxID=582402 RepID=C6XMN2_HIRBI|nr:SDR family NAD(P)-dependent oxidoreductase [Hirschia baltica]ACT59946.1 short-chain dehydrogenase/reductase SDR [Hirschia baltica ATCC 49814]